MKDGERQIYRETGRETCGEREREGGRRREKRIKLAREREEQKKKRTREREREREREGESRRESYEWVLGVCILDPGQALSDRERCGSSPG